MRITEGMWNNKLFNKVMKNGSKKREGKQINKRVSEGANEWVRDWSTVRDPEWLQENATKTTQTKHKFPSNYTHSSSSTCTHSWKSSFRVFSHWICVQSHSGWSEQKKKNRNSTRMAIRFENILILCTIARCTYSFIPFLQQTASKPASIWSSKLGASFYLSYTKTQVQIICFYYHRVYVYECDSKRNECQDIPLYDLRVMRVCAVRFRSYFFFCLASLWVLNFKLLFDTAIPDACEYHAHSSKNQSQSKWKTLTQQKTKTFTFWLNGTLFFPHSSTLLFFFFSFFSWNAVDSIEEGERKKLCIYIIFRKFTAFWFPWIGCAL